MNRSSVWRSRNGPGDWARVRACEYLRALIVSCEEGGLGVASRAQSLLESSDLLEDVHISMREWSDA